MFFAPLAGMIPAYATAGALIYVAMLMMGGMAHIEWDEATGHVFMTGPIEIEGTGTLK